MLKNIIFDLGGVIYQLDFPRFNHNLRALQRQAQDTPIYSRLHQPPVFSDYERGTIDTPTFRARMRTELNLVATDAEIDQAWNSLLVGVFPDRKQLLSQLKPHYKLALLSNINDLHLEYVQRDCGEIFNLFDHCFFSCELGTRKPEPQIFQIVLDRMGFLPQETLFIDDSPPNVVGAEKLGIVSICLTDPNQLLAILQQHCGQILLPS
ncbi:MAG: HAD family phosphatase [Pseudanabaenaceae cyanobacterium SKYGB_i_bin29]|nr:HAD family phosphatase [Pseudanabaenaceae cyanobacterium SKYG29]MDW8420821.1 HAD family phosphatase [Pseudanabaenaceae cyanobacterium SKYGB_i_bin29]